MAVEDLVNLNYEFGERDFKNNLLKAQQSNVDAIMSLSIKHEAEIINRQKIDLGIRTPIVCGYRLNCFPEDMDKDYFEGSISFDFETNDEKIDNISEYDFVNYGFGYDMMQTIAEAAVLCEEVSRECLHDGLKKVNQYESLIGTRGYDENRNMIVDVELLELREGVFVGVN